MPALAAAQSTSAQLSCGPHSTYPKQTSKSFRTHTYGGLLRKKVQTARKKDQRRTSAASPSPSPSTDTKPECIFLLFVYARVVFCLPCVKSATLRHFVCAFFCALPQHSSPLPRPRLRPCLFYHAPPASPVKCKKGAKSAARTKERSLLCGSLSMLTL